MGLTLRKGSFGLQPLKHNCEGCCNSGSWPLVQQQLPWLAPCGHSMEEGTTLVPLQTTNYMASLLKSWATPAKDRGGEGKVAGRSKKVKRQNWGWGKQKRLGEWVEGNRGCQAKNSNWRGKRKKREVCKYFWVGKRYSNGRQGMETMETWDSLPCSSSWETIHNAKNVARNKFHTRRFRNNSTITLECCLSVCL